MGIAYKEYRSSQRRLFILSSSYDPVSSLLLLPSSDDIVSIAISYSQRPMMATLIAGVRNLHTPRSPASTSTDSSRRGSVNQGLPEQNNEQQNPVPLQTRITRKRAASLNTESANEPRIGDLALSSASTSGPTTSDPTREQVCLCQPDPKIPRPRNGEKPAVSFSFTVARCDRRFTVLAHPLFLIMCPKSLCLRLEN